MKTSHVLILCLTFVTVIVLLSRCEMHRIDYNGPRLLDNDIPIPSATVKLAPMSHPQLTPDPQIVPPQ